LAISFIYSSTDYGSTRARGEDARALVLHGGDANFLGLRGRPRTDEIMERTIRGVNGFEAAF